jgi:hypothetical protein
MDIPISIRAIPTILTPVTAGRFFVIRLAKIKRHMPAMIAKIANKRYICLFLQKFQILATLKL